MVGPKFKKVVEDKNASAQEKGLDALIAWIDRAESPTRFLFTTPDRGLTFFGRLTGLCPLIIDKCFGGRANTKQKAVDALLLFIEVDTTGEAVAVRI